MEECFSVCSAKKLQGVVTATYFMEFKECIRSKSKVKNSGDNVLLHSALKYKVVLCKPFSTNRAYACNEAFVEVK